ncbi:MAG: septal ring lytic transglycosylase RlpA family protein [Flavisolibacter sp.]
MKYHFVIFTLVFFFLSNAQSGTVSKEKKETTKKTSPKKPKIIYGIASYYAEKFNGRQTANGEIYDGKKLTAACNQLPLGTWIRVTNLNNNRSVIVKTNDRLHIRMKRVVDLSRAAAEKLGYISRGLTKVRVEVLEKK